MLIPLRDENPRVIIPKVTYAIVALNIAVFLLQMGVGSDPISEREFTLSYGLIPAIDDSQCARIRIGFCQW